MMAARTAIRSALGSTDHMLIFALSFESCLASCLARRWAVAATQHPFPER